MGKVHLNGRIVDESEARISVNDRGLLYGDGIFDTMRAYDGVPFRIEDHIDRLLDSARELELKVESSPDEIKAIVARLLEANDLKDAYVRITVTRGGHSGNLSFAQPGRCTFLVQARPVVEPSAGEYERGVAATLVHDAAQPEAMARHKTLSYLPYLAARQKALEAGAKEAFITDRDGMVLESATANIFVVKEGEIFTPPLSAGILGGIARKTVIGLLPEIGLAVNEMPLAVKDLSRAQEIFVTNSIVEALSVTRIDGQALGEKAGKIALSVREAYRREVKEYIDKRR